MVRGPGLARVGLDEEGRLADLLLEEDAVESREVLVHVVEVVGVGRVRLRGPRVGGGQAREIRGVLDGFVVDGVEDSDLVEDPVRRVVGIGRGRGVEERLPEVAEHVAKGLDGAHACKAFFVGKAKTREGTGAGRTRGARSGRRAGAGPRGGCRAFRRRSSGAPRSRTCPTRRACGRRRRSGVRGTRPRPRARPWRTRRRRTRGTRRRGRRSP